MRFTFEKLLLYKFSNRNSHGISTVIVGWCLADGIKCYQETTQENQDFASITHNSL
jgi:hypothetical protein